MDEKLTPTPNTTSPVSEDSSNFSEFQLISKKPKNSSIKVILIALGVILSIAFFVGFYFLLGFINS